MSPRLIPIVSAVLASALLDVARAAEISIDCSRTNGPVRPLHGLNKGPLCGGGIIDLTAAQRELAPPYTRLHDCHWPNPDVVDIHTVFPNPGADPTDPASYRFEGTDEYLDAVEATGAQVVYRLGESIEHTKVKRFVHPPSDLNRWAQVCVGIVRHCNEGWANGKRRNIRYWEIWNEPENRPVMWSGTDDQFLALYATAARAVKQHDPSLKVGGPSFGYTGQFVAGRFQSSSFVTNFLRMCQRESVPLDFFSWHCYTANVSELVDRARAIRALLDSFGLHKAESHLNEWNYLPGNSWTALSRKASGEQRQAACDEMAGLAGAAFVSGALIALQEAPVDVCNLYHAETGCFGLFTEQGGRTKSYFAVQAFSRLVANGVHTAVTRTAEGAMTAMAAVSTKEVRILVSRQSAKSELLRLRVNRLPWTGSKRVLASAEAVDGTRNLAALPCAVETASNNGDEVSVSSTLSQGCALLRLRPASE